MRRVALAVLVIVAYPIAVVLATWWDAIRRRPW